MARIAILTSVHQPFDTRIFQKQARALAAAGHDVTLIAPHTGDLVRDGVRLRALPPVGGRFRRMLLRPLRVLVEALRTRAEICHFHDPELLVVGFLLKVMGRRVIYDVHEDVPKDIRAKAYLPVVLRRPLAWLVGRLQRTLSKTFDRVFVAREDLQAAFVGHPGLRLIRNFPSLAAFDAAAESPRSAHAGLRLVYAGGLSPIRGIVEMIAALELVPGEFDTRMDVFGRFSPPSFGPVVRGLPGFRLVDYHGEVPYQLLPPGLAAADVGVVCFLPVPNNINSGPTKLFEYMASGLPVVASHFPMWREVVEGNRCGIVVDPTEPASIAAAYEVLARDPALRRQMGENGRRAVREKYSWEAEAQRLVADYDVLARS